MKIIKKIWIAGCLLILLLLAAGCSGGVGSIQVDTQLTVDTSFNGERVMTAVIPSSMFKRAFNSNTDSVKDMVEKYAPNGVYCTVEANDDKSATIQIHIDFASRRQYQQIIEGICSGNTADDAVKPVLKFDYSNSVLKNGYTIEENFSSLDLLYWLNTGLAEEYPSLADQGLEKLLLLGKTEVVFNGETKDMSATGIIQISTIESNAFNSITVTTTLNDDRTLDGEIEYVVSNEVIAVLGTKLDDLMNGIVPTDGEKSYSDNDNDRTYVITFHSETDNDFIVSMNQALHVDDTTFTLSTAGDSESLAATTSVVQYFDGSYFLDFTDENTQMQYVLRTSPKYSVNSCIGTYGYLTSYDVAYTSNNCCLTMVVNSAEEVTTVFGFAVDIDSVDIATTIYSEKHIERIMSFKLSGDANALIGSGIQERLNTAASRWDDEAKMRVSMDDFLSWVQYSITMDADSMEELTQMTVAVLGKTESEESTDSVFLGGPEAKTNPWKMRYAVEDTLNLSAFLSGSQIANGISYTLKYPDNYKAAFTETNIFDDAKAEGETVTCSTYNKVLTVKTEAQKYNLEGIIIVILLVVSFLVIVILAVLNIAFIQSFIQNKKISIVDGEFFKGKRGYMLAAACVACVCFVIMLIRLLFKVY